MNMSPLIVPAPIRMPRVEPMSTRLRIKARSTRGAAERRSTATKAKVATTDMTKQEMVATDVQPQLDPSLTPRISGARMAATKKVPSQSMERDRVGSRDSLTLRKVRGTQTAPMAAEIQNKPCQPVVSTRTPPTNGPMAAPIAAAAPQNETARSRSLPELAIVSRLIPQARIVEPAAP